MENQKPTIAHSGSQSCNSQRNSFVISARDSHGRTVSEKLNYLNHMNNIRSQIVKSGNTQLLADHDRTEKESRQKLFGDDPKMNGININDLSAFEAEVKLLLQ